MGQLGRVFKSKQLTYLCHIFFISHPHSSKILINNNHLWQQVTLPSSVITFTYHQVTPFRLGAYFHQNSK